MGRRTELTPSSFGQMRSSLYNPFFRPALVKRSTQLSQEASEQ